jgi:hypothetical protein
MRLLDWITGFVLLFYLGYGVYFFANKRQVNCQTIIEWCLLTLVGVVLFIIANRKAKFSKTPKP